MKIGGFQRCSLIDYPGHVSCVIFTQGCNLRCPYCHNPELVYPEKYRALISETEIFDFLNKRINKLEGIVITGGEPTLQNDLLDFVKTIKRLGFKVKLDTNGTNPVMLKNLLSRELLDFIAMDIKAPFDKYHILSGVTVDIANIKESIRLIETSKLEYLFRTTMDKEHLNDQDMVTIKSILKSSEQYLIQECTTLTQREQIKVKG